MKFLPDNFKSGKIVKDSYTHYFIWDSDTEHIENDIMYVRGIEVMTINPTTQYFYSSDYYGWERMYQAPPFTHHYGVCQGSVVTDQLPLFNIHQTFAIWKRMFATEGFDHYIMTLVGVSLLEYRYRYNITICLDYCQSKTVQHLSKLYALSGLAPEPIKIKFNEEDDKDFKNYEIPIEFKQIEYINENFLHLGECLARYEIDNAINGRKNMPRFWEQRISESIDLSEIICDNQIDMLKPL
jgi:hypothetical protein